MIARRLRALTRHPHPGQYLQGRCEIAMNRLVWPHETPASDDWDSFRRAVDAVYDGFYAGTERGSAAWSEYEAIRARLLESHPADVVGIPDYFDADPTLALSAYVLTEAVLPTRVIECGVGRGVTSAMLLAACARKGSGFLTSLDLPSLSDPEGVDVGLAVRDDLHASWSLLVGSSRSLLPELLRAAESVQYFVSDSANVYTLQRWEIRCVWPRLAAGGCILVNNVGRKLLAWVSTLDGARVLTSGQMSKRGCVTALIVKDPAG